MNYHQRILAAVITLASTALTLAAAPAAFAKPLPPSDCCTSGLSTPVTVIAGGMPGWQITLIAAGAALAGGALAILLDRARAARKTHPTTA
jgi:hypothetical protein